ncbi:hypothetical protein CHS0354_017599 [Potamilus streckersoni]|uniref:BPL/LPL catalytic domain-containing protein n=1 Tax=Potamilus streckersoni TaxID=2493646 RepID=A0AAE0RP32_9BIVA|nr:hypothetical protein CHS0354_017599 [Potamilus streckersoni]
MVALISARIMKNLNWNHHRAWMIFRTFVHNVSNDHKFNTRHVVLVSKSTDIFENLALEDWLYEKADLEKDSILLMWRNTPSIVIGLHQNPWIECNVPEAEKQMVPVVRRKSGGGTVYHDEGNLNVSFLKHRKLYNRVKNLELVVAAISSRWNVDLSINQRDDIILDGLYKISGTASKLGGTRTYHHFTLLSEVDTSALHRLLHSQLMGIESHATNSTRAQVANLRDIISDLNIDALIEEISKQFLRGKGDLVAGPEYVNPIDEVKYPGVTRKLEELRSWEWIFGRTPDFSLQRTYTATLSGKPISFSLNLKFRKGRIMELNVSDICSWYGSWRETLQKGFQDCRYFRADICARVSSVKMNWILADIYNNTSSTFLDWTLHCLLASLYI